LSEYKHRLEDGQEEEEDEEDEEDEGDLKFFVPINENKNKAESIINEWIRNRCVKSKATAKGVVKKTRRNKQRQKNKTQTQRRKSKKRKTKRLYK
jgi:hypothetical protein